MKLFNKITACALAALIMLLAPVVMAADSYISLNGFSFSINSNGEAVIFEYDGDETNVVIPEKLLGAYVAEISSYAFNGNSSIKTVDLGNASRLSRIGDNAFNGCSSLSEITIPETVEEIGFGAFQNCCELKTAVINGNISKLPSQCFYNCENLSSIKLSDSIAKIGEFALSECDSLTHITISNSVSEISDNAFSGSDDIRILCERGSDAYEYAQSMNIDTVVPDECPLGDVNLDGKVDIIDVTQIQKYKIGDSKAIDTELQLRLADVNRDGKVTIRDATLIQMYLAKYFDQF